MEPAEIHQIEGFDARNRMFNRNIFIYKKERNYSARLTYEDLFFETPQVPTSAEAISDLIQSIKQQSFSQLRTRLNFKGQRYLTEQEPWIAF